MNCGLLQAALRYTKFIGRSVDKCLAPLPSLGYAKVGKVWVVKVVARSSL
jgi:hypothetical protein